MFRSIAILLLLAVVNIAKAAPPRKDAPIAIVGAGFSGLSAAYTLVQAGYTNITIYEKSERVGGYVTTVDYKGISHDLATYAMTATYWKFQEAMEGIGAKFCDLFVNIINTTASPPVADPYTKLLIELGKESLLIPSTYPVALIAQIEKYKELWLNITGLTFKSETDERTDRLFPEKPTDPEKIAEMAMPMRDWLNKYKLGVIDPIFVEATDSQAYGPVQTTPALYFFTWFPPLLFDPRSGAGLVPCGPTPSMQALADLLHQYLTAQGVKTYFESEVKAVIRGRKGRKAILLEHFRARKRFDAIIVTAKLAYKGLRKSVVKFPWPIEVNATRAHEELEVFSSLWEAPRKDAIKTKGFLLIDQDAMTMQSPNTSFWGSLSAEWRNGTNNGNTHLNDETLVRVGATYFFKERQEGVLVNKPVSELEDAVEQGFAKWDDAKYTNLRSHSYDGYFQRWRSDGVSALLPWALEDMQGKGRVYYVNSAACGFESVGHVFDCADLLIKKFFM